MAVKKKRQRKNKKWIPWKQLTPEEREQLRRESDKKSFRKLLKETKERATAAENSGNYLEMIHAPRPTNEVAVSPRRVRTRIIRTTTRKRDTWISGMFTTWWKTMTRKIVRAAFPPPCAISSRAAARTIKQQQENAMWLSDEWKDYEVIDTSSGEKLERWGKYILVRPDPQVIWSTPKNHPLWRKYDAKYSRSNTGGGKWSNLHLPEQWQVRYKELTFNVKPMNFKHTGVFPEQAANWDFAMEKIRGAGRPISVLNLFAYTGGATIACAAAGASVCHVDAAKGMVAWAK